MPGPRRRDRRTASSRNPVEVRRLLQRDADTFIAVERRTQASACAAAESGQSGEGAARRWTASRIPAAGGMRPTGRISGRHSHLPAEIPFHGHTLHRGWVLWVLIEERYVVFYECPLFFSRKGESTLPGLERLGRGMAFARIPAEQLPGIVQAQLEIMHKKLELEVEEEALNGWSIRPAGI